MVCVEVHGSRQSGHCCWMLETQLAHTHTWPHGSRTWLAWGVGVAGWAWWACHGEGAMGRVVVQRVAVRAPARSRGALRVGRCGGVRWGALRVA